MPPSASTDQLDSKNKKTSSLTANVLRIAIYLVPLITYVLILKYKNPTFINPNAAAQINVVKAVLTGNISAVFNGVWGNIFILPTIIIHRVVNVDIATALMINYQLSGIALLYSLILLARKLEFNLNITLLFSIVVSITIAKIIKTGVISSDLMVATLTIVFYMCYQRWHQNLVDNNIKTISINPILGLVLLIVCSDQIAFVAIIIYMIVRVMVDMRGKIRWNIKAILSDKIIKESINLILRALVIGSVLSGIYIIKYNQWHPLPLVRFNNQIGSPTKVESMHPLSGKKLEALNTYNYFSNWDDPSTINLSTHHYSIVDILKAKAMNLNDSFDQSPNYVSNIMALGAYIFLLIPIILAVLIMYGLYYKDRRVTYIVELYLLSIGLIALQAINYVELRHFYLISLIFIVIIFYGFNLVFLNRQYAYMVTILSLIMIRLNSVGMDFKRYHSVYIPASHQLWQHQDNSKESQPMRNLSLGTSNLEPSSGLEIWSPVYVQDVGSINSLSDEYWPEKIEALHINYFIYQREVNYDIVNNRLLQMGFVKEETFDNSDGTIIYLYKRI